jgi:hypothetical protein
MENPVFTDQTFMKRTLVLSLLSCTLLVACAPAKVHKKTAPAPFGYTETPAGTVAPEEIPPVAPDANIPAAAPTPAPQPSQPAPAATPVPAKREAVYGIPVAGKLGFMKSPFHPDAGLIDYRGLPSGTEVKDPYTPGKIILVP